MGKVRLFAFFVPLCFIYLILFLVVFSVLWSTRQRAAGNRGAGGQRNLMRQRGGAGAGGGGDFVGEFEDNDKGAPHSKG